MWFDDLLIKLWISQGLALSNPNHPYSNLVELLADDDDTDEKEGRIVTMKFLF